MVDILPHTAKTRRQAAESSHVSFHRIRDIAHEDEIAEIHAAMRKTLYPAGCGELFLLGWAGLTFVHCGATLNDLGGKTSILRCEECSKKEVARNQSK